eukprot:5448865-Prymnesium_polylepis.1
MLDVDVEDEARLHARGALEIRLKPSHVFRSRKHSSDWHPLNVAGSEYQGGSPLEREQPSIRHRV